MQDEPLPTTPRFQNLTGKTFSRWTVLRFAGFIPQPNGKKRTMWECCCSCGSIGTVLASNLKQGHSLSCGCLVAETTRARSTTHGYSVAGGITKEYLTWQRIKGRCHNPKNHKFPDYGGRGIIVDPSWIDDFPAFLAHVGPCPSTSHSIDRIENDGNYEPGNVRWATRKTQANNKRNNRLLFHNGQTLNATQWAEKTNIPASSIIRRLNLGWSDEKTLTTPIGNNHGRNKK